MAAVIFKTRCPMDCVKYLGFAGIWIKYEVLIINYELPLNANTCIRMVKFFSINIEEAYE